MINHSLNITDLRLLLPETLWIEPEYFEQARQMSDRFDSEEQQWKAYLNTLAMLTLEAWFKEKLPGQYVIQRGSGEFREVCYLGINEFNLCVIATEHVLDEVIRVPKMAIDQLGLAAHFYIALEVLEEQEQAIVRGFAQYNDLKVQVNRTDSSESDELYLLPLSAFDAEINHLTVYVQHLVPSPLGVADRSTPLVEAVKQGSNTAKTRLNQWLQGVLDEGWQTIDALLNPEMTLAWSTRHASLGAKGGKLINLGMQLGEQTVVLLITVTPDTEGKTGVNVQVLPAKGVRALPAELKLSLFSALDKILQEVQSREQDNYIQLKPFKGKPGTNFSIEVSFNNIRVRETFEL